jgi:hypothetical protein
MVASVALKGAVGFDNECCPRLSKQNRKAEMRRKHIAALDGARLSIIEPGSRFTIDASRKVGGSQIRLKRPRDLSSLWDLLNVKYTARHLLPVPSPGRLFAQRRYLV